MEEIRMTVRLPISAVRFLDDVRKQSFTSRNAEIVRCIRERMEREAAGAEFGDRTPAADHITHGIGGTADD